MRLEEYLLISEGKAADLIKEETGRRDKPVNSADENANRPG